MQSRYIVNHPGDSATHIICENRNCIEGRSDSYYDVRQASDDGWWSKEADLVLNPKTDMPEKASPFNNAPPPFKNNIAMEIYCPACKPIIMNKEFSNE